jgi:hypothetical protein
MRNIRCVKESMSPVRKHASPPASEERERERERGKGKVGCKGARERKGLEGGSVRMIEGEADKAGGRRETEERRECTRTFVQRHDWGLECLIELEERACRLVSAMACFGSLSSFS